MGQVDADQSLTVKVELLKVHQARAFDALYACFGATLWLVGTAHLQKNNDVFPARPMALHLSAMLRHPKDHESPVLPFLSHMYLTWPKLQPKIIIAALKTNNNL